jgi:hypothetical protein
MDEYLAADQGGPIQAKANRPNVPVNRNNKNGECFCEVALHSKRCFGATFCWVNQNICFQEMLCL